MGLDMSLTKRTYVRNWARDAKEHKYKIVVTKGGKPTNIRTERISYIIENIHDWRKANQIHAWFVENVQDGDDNCGEYYVSREKLQQLLSLCEQVIKASKLVSGKVTNGYRIEADSEGKAIQVPILEDGKYIEDPSIAKELLPNQSGFFFGSQDYNEWYLQDIIETRDVLKEAVKDQDSDYYYDSSW